MRELKVVGLDADGKNIVCEVADPAEKLALRADDRLRAAMRGDITLGGQAELDIEVSNTLSAKEIQSRIRAGASVEQVTEVTGGDTERVKRFAHPVLLERSRAAQLATAAHPVLADGPAVLTLLEVVTTALVARGLCPDSTDWDAWRNEDGHWTVQMAWKAGRSDNVAHFRFVPGAHGGTVTAVDDEARALIDPTFDRPIRPLAPVATLAFDEPAAPPAAQPAETPAETSETSETSADEQAPAQPPARDRRGKPPIPAWEDVLLGVRSGAQR
jgi:hypothetical protein